MVHRTIADDGQEPMRRMVARPFHIKVDAAHAKTRNCWRNIGQTGEIYNEKTKLKK